MDRIHAFISGSVQGVFFRAFAKREADRMGIVGTARNLDDGRVEIIAEGEGDVLVDFVEALKTKHPTADVKDIDTKWELAKGEFGDFSIIE